MILNKNLIINNREEIKMTLGIGTIIIITLLAFIMQVDEYGTEIGLIYPGIIGPITGLILGDLHTGLLVGGTLQLMALGVAAIGGASVPNYGSAAIIATTLAISTGQGVEAGLALGLPVGMLGIQFNVLAKIANGFVVRKSQKYAKNKEFKKMTNVLILCPILIGLSTAIPVFISITFGSQVIQYLLDTLPAWFSSGLTIAGKVLPVVGIAMLLRFMPTKKFIHYALIGFVLSAYLKLPILGVAIVGFAAAFNMYTKKVNEQVAYVGGSDEDE